jgi:hypothetical protein
MNPYLFALLVFGCIWLCSLAALVSLLWRRGAAREKARAQVAAQALAEAHFAKWEQEVSS